VVRLKIPSTVNCCRRNLGELVMKMGINKKKSKDTQMIVQMRLKKKKNLNISKKKRAK